MPWISIRTTSAATETMTTPDDVRLTFADRINRKRPLQPGGRFDFQATTELNDDHPGTDIDAAIEVDHILVAHPDAAGRYVGADGPGLVGAVDAIER
jgi:hypothetical protein